MSANELAARIDPIASDDPYRRPRAEVGLVDSASTAAIADVSAGQKFVIYAILMYIAAMVATPVFSVVIGSLVLLGSLGMSWVGMYRISRGLGHAMWVRLVLLMMTLVPLIGLLVLLRLNAQATKRLQASGYSVGLLGARARANA